MNTAGVSSLRGELETQTSLDEDLEEQERQRWIEDGKQMWRQELGKRHLPDDFSDPAPHLTDLEKHRNRVRRDENREGTKIWDRNQMSSKEKESEGQGSRSRHGDRLSFESYDGGQNIPASTSNEEVRQQRPNSPTVQAREAGKQRRTGVLRGGHLETTNLAEARETTNVPKVEKETRLIRTPGVLTVEQAEMYARLASVGLRPKFVAPPAPVSQPASKESSFRYLGYHYTDEGDIILPFPIKRNMEGAPMMSVDGLVHPCAARPHEKESTAAESASMSQMGGARTGDMRERGGATRGKSGMVRGGKSTRGRASTRGGGAARGGCQTALPQQAPRGQFQRSSHLQGPSTLPMHDPSVMTGEDSHHVHSQMGEMERPPIDRVPQPLGPINGYVHSDGISQCRPSGFMPIPRSIPPPYAIPGKHLAGPQQQRPNLGQDQEDITISSMGPIPGTSYKFPSLEGDLIITEDRGHQRPFPNQAQQPPVVISISNSRMELPPPLFPYGQGRHGEYNMQTYMPPAAERDPQDSLPTPSQGPATMPRATPHLAESGAQQPLPTASQEPAMPPSAGSCSRQQIPTSPQRAQFLPRPATWPWVQPPHHEGRDGSQSGQVGQTVVQPLEEERASLPVQHSQPAIPGTAVIDFAPVAQNRPS